MTRSFPRAEEAFYDHELGVGRADQVRRQQHARRPHLVHERDDHPLRKHYGADVEDIRKGIGSGLPHRAVVPQGRLRLRRIVLPQRRRRHGAHQPRQAGHDSLFVHAIQTVNANQKKRFAEKIINKLGRPIEGSTIAVWGLAFKADTDDIRESAAMDVIRYAAWTAARMSKPMTPKGDGEHEAGYFKDEVEWSPDPVTCRRRFAMRWRC